MDLSQIITPVHLYFLGLLSMEYIDLQQSFISDDGGVYFNLDLNKLPIPNIEIPTKGGLVRRYTSVEGILRDELFETTFFKYGENYSQKHFTPKRTDEYYIYYDTLTKKADSFAIRHNGRLYMRTHEYIQDTMYLMKVLKYADFRSYNKIYEEFNRQADDWVRKKIRAISPSLKGEYVKDMINKDTYFQVRRFEGQNIYYIIYHWWDKVRQGSVMWNDVVNGEGTVYIALNH